MGNKCSSRKQKPKSTHELNMEARMELVNKKENEVKFDDNLCANDCMDASVSKEKNITLRQAALRNRSISCLTETDHLAIATDPKDFVFDFENLVLEGGGNKGLAYCGAIKYLHEVGVMKNIKRIAGASAGAMTAALITVGYNPEEIEDFLGNNISDVFIDHSCGYCSLLPNLISGYGWNPGKKIYKWFGDKMRLKTGNPDVTFQEVYQQFGIELCVVVTNLSLMTTEYCHPKTTPNMAVRFAVRMSMAIPGMFSATKFTSYGQTDVYVDGGVLCNYPIHCFDGWYLSMEPGNSFIEKLQPLSELPRLYDKTERFGTFNSKTLGFLLFADNERDILRYNLENRIGVLQPLKPSSSTKLFEEKSKKKQIQDKLAVEHGRVVRAVDSFLKVLKRHNIDNNDDITLEELENAFKDEQLTKEEKTLLFGKDIDVHEAFQLLDNDKSGQIKYSELIHFIESTGICFQTRFLGYQRKDVKNFVSFLDSLQSTLLTNVKRIYVDERDMERTVGINTGHIGTTDFKCEEADREFVVARGYNATKSYLQYCAATRDLPKSSLPKSCLPVIAEATKQDNDLPYVDANNAINETTQFVQ
ncbi:uncharacterized protein LOC126808761 [Patella vulgata]|uniref:uncharacterized protein LOC126808761 n=1 Tax=Patella vulgata TaxID=6465 RepID=UPI00217FBE3F|nr:uncharacterized protein LOC126808761 [Patella vulgata]XP_055959498.1 uncharacterized protein LOC126808761 [Patella vulgata]XP_055959500.1 uncharacterized protein LOC126808761 [Patella vulgata]XP_055959501.1 uncharacterized protein LOC126808761 [Patella vulgata]